MRVRISHRSRSRWLAASLLVLVAGCDRAPTPAAPPVASGAIEAALTAAESYLDGDQLLEAELILARLIERTPKDRRAREMLGRVLTLKAMKADELGDEDAARTTRQEAYEHYRVAATQPPEGAGLHQSAGVLATMAGDHAAAAGHFEAAAVLAPSSPQHPLYAAQSRLMLGEHASARSHLERVLLLDPDQAEAHASLAIIALELGELEDALAWITEARGIAPTDLGLRIQEARIRRRRGEPNQARSLLEGLGPEVRADPVVAEELAASLVDLDEHEAAAAVWEHCFASGPQRPHAWRAAARAAEVYLLAGDIGRAHRWYRQAAVQNPDAPEVVALARRLADEP